MKKTCFMLALLAVQLTALAQTTVTFKPGPALGDNTIVMTTYGCTSTGYPTPAENFVFGPTAEVPYIDWTYNAGGCPHGTTRSLLRFNQLSSIPSGATILSAQLRLYGVPTSGNFGNSTYPGSPYPLSNDGYVYQVGGPWSIGTVTWTSQPAITGTPVAIPPSTSRFNYNATMNVTSMVQNMVTTGANNGFMLKLQTEAYYRSVIMAGNNHADPSLWPELVITYTSCDATFTSCTDANNPYTLKLSANTLVTGQYYQWSVNGAYAGTGANFNYVCPGPGTYSVCLQILDKNQRPQCNYCMNICVASNRTPQPPVTPDPPASKGGQRIGQIPVGDMPVTRTSMIAPNPTHDGWNIHIENMATTRSTATITLYDINGKVISKQTRELNSGNNEIYQPAANLAPGTYMIEYTNGKTSWKEKVVKQ